MGHIMRKLSVLVQIISFSIIWPSSKSVLVFPGFLANHYRYEKNLRARKCFSSTVTHEKLLIGTFRPTFIWCPKFKLIFHSKSPWEKMPLDLEGSNFRRIVFRSIGNFLDPSVPGIRKNSHVASRYTLIIIIMAKYSSIMIFGSRSWCWERQQEKGI